ncbi:uncharacterized protein LOC124372573, partial [Homalodisca vitripennis]|uniref:uncharacterized protein LOC124372573 n=1 Tax=Homalodisca vitripennis TaxID=197043 RepID=UPI001EEA66E6
FVSKIPRLSKTYDFVSHAVCQDLHAFSIGAKPTFSLKEIHVPADSGDEWYRSLCVQESVAGVSTQKLLDFGNIFTVPTTDIRQMLPEFLNFPALGLACEIKGLPSELSPEQKAKLKSLLAVDGTMKVTFESEEGDYYNINIPALTTSLLS